MTDELERLRRRLDRERRTRREAERIAERALLDLHTANRVLQTQNDELERFAGVIAHDLRLPLTAVTGFVRTVIARFADELNPTVSELLARADDAAGRMDDLIDDLLAYAQTGYKELRLAEVDTNELLSSVLSELGEPSARVECGYMPTLAGDRGLLGQIFANLIGNAVKYVADGTEPKVYIFAERSVDGWVFRVTDNGVGIPMEERERIFEPFERHRGDEFHGTGIGLSICRRAVERHGGRIWIEDPAGGGTTFAFTIVKLG